MPKAGDIILIPFPFTDLSGEKIRPALILATQENGNNMTVCFISSVVDKKLYKFDVLVNEKEINFKNTRLKVNSVIKTTKIATLDKTIALGKMGKLDDKNFKKVSLILRNYFTL